MPKMMYSIPAEKLIDGKMIVTHVTTKPNIGHYTCTIPWKGEGPNLVNNINEVLARQRRTNSSDYLVKKGTSLKEIMMLLFYPAYLCLYLIYGIYTYI